jgi:hypothetical protein
MPKFWKDYDRSIGLLLDSTNNYYVNKSDKLSLVKEMSPLERNHLRYLLMKDQSIIDMHRNNLGCKIFMAPFLYSFGLI